MSGQGFILPVIVMLLQSTLAYEYFSFRGYDSVTLQCDQGDVKLEQAYYPCVDYNFVEQYFTDNCDGRDTCTVTADELEEAAGQPCTWEEEITGSYGCAVELTCDSCSGPVEYYLEPTVYYRIDHDSPCGQPACPLVFNVDLGRSIDITVRDNTWELGEQEVFPNELTEEQLENCTYRVTMNVPGAEKSVTVCGGYQQEWFVNEFSDVTQQVSVTWEKNVNYTSDFSIFTEADGCPIIEMQEGGWLFHIDGEFAAGCLYTDHVWEQDCNFEGDNALEWSEPLYQCQQDICPDGSDVEAADSDSCDSGIIPLYENNDLIGCCQENTQIAYCADGSAPIDVTYIGCPSGFLFEIVASQQKCCPLYTQRPECPNDRNSVPLVENLCEVGTEKIYSKKNYRIWAGCCTQDPTDD